VVSLAKRSARATSCENNLRQLQLAWLGYADENNDRLVPNKSRSTGLIQRSDAPSWVLGNAKWDYSPTNIESGLLFSHARSLGMYRCPSDQSQVKTSRVPTRRIRSYSLSVYLAGDLVGKGMQGNPREEPRFKTKLAALLRPARTFAFVDEQEESIDDGLFSTYDPIHWSEPNAGPELKTWLEMPSDRHNRGCNLSFADGHAESLRWKWPKVFEEYDQRPANELDKADLQTLQALLGIR
jgi:prepilin-type processing-associated H-X9-DG protein